MRTSIGLIAFVFSTCLFFGCSTQSRVDVPGVAAGYPGQLPDLSSLPPRGSSVTEGLVVRMGSEYEPGFPTQRASTLGQEVRLTPVGQEFEDIAFAVYELDLTGYDRGGNFEFEWSTAPGAGLFLVALADFDTRRWIIHTPADAQNLAAGDLVAYTADDNRLLIAPIVMGDAQAVLSRLRLGPALALPLASLDASPISGDPPLLVSYDGSSSSDSVPGSIVQYEIDFGEGLGYGTILDPVGQHTYNLEGSYTLRLRVTDDDGNQSEDSEVITVNAGNQPPVADIQADFTTGDAPLLVTFDASGSSDPELGVLSYEWDYDGNGTIDESTGTIAAGQYTYVPGTYEALLRVTDDGALIDEDTITIVVDTPPPPVFDETENNQNRGEANLLPAFDFSGWTGSMGSGSGYVAYDGDFSDWFEIPAALVEGDSVSFILTYDSSTDVGLMQFGLYDASTLLVTGSNMDANTKQFSHVIEADDVGPFFIQVHLSPPPPFDAYSDYTLSGVGP